MDCVEANRSIAKQREQFAVRLYEWSKRDLEREIDAGFPRVKRVKSSRAFHYLDFLRSLPVRERPAAALALFYARHKKHLSHVKKISIGSAEATYIAKFQERFYPVGLRSESEIELLSKSPPEEFDIDRDELEEIIENEVSRVLQLPLAMHKGHSVKQKVGAWFVRTSVDVHSVFQLRYGHTITAREADDLCPVQLLEYGTSLLSWLGVHADTSFNLLRKSELQQTAVFVSELIHHFLSAAPVLLTGLEHEIPPHLETG